MDLEDIEFLAEKESIGIIPNFNFDAIHLISNTIGPFRAGLPLHVPLWLAIHMKKQQKCRIVPPTWIDRELLEEQKELEKREPTFSKMPCDNFMVVSKLIFSCASEDLSNVAEVKTLIKDIFDIREAKLRMAIHKILSGGNPDEEYRRVSFTNLTSFEISTVRPFLPYASDLVARLERVCQQHTSNLSDTFHTSHFTSSTY